MNGEAKRFSGTIYLERQNDTWHLSFKPDDSSCDSLTEQIFNSETEVRKFIERRNADVPSDVLPFPPEYVEQIIDESKHGPTVVFRYIRFTKDYLKAWGFSAQSRGNT